MIHYWVILETYRIFIKGYKLLSFAKNMSKNIGKNMSKNLSRKYNQNFLIMLNNLQQIRLKLLQKEQFKTAEVI